MTGQTVAELNWEGQLNLYALYQPENDIPEQRVILEELYHATAGDGWQPLVYHQTEPLQQVLKFMAYYATDPGMLQIRWLLNVKTTATAENGWQPADTIYVDFPFFVNLVLLKVPWFTPGFSYCRWWYVPYSFYQSPASVWLDRVRTQRQEMLISCIFGSGEY